jgi:ABC-type branched-subunit amino acid transport system substrate-binding protein
MSGRGWRTAIVMIALAWVLAAGCGRQSNGSAGAGATTGVKTGAKTPGAPTATVGFNGKTISLGIITIQSGPAASTGQPWTNGNLAYIDQVNAKGGVAGRYKIKPIVVDSAIDTQRAVQEYNQLSGSVVMFGNVLGTVVVNAVLPQLQRDGVVAVPGSLDSTWLHQPNLAPWFAPYQIEAANGLSWYVDQQGKAKKVCSAVQADTYGQAVQAGASSAAKSNGIALTKTVTFLLTDTDYTAPVTALRDAGCDAVVLGSSLPGTAGMSAKAASIGFAPEWIAMNPGWDPALGQSKLARYFAQHLVVVADGPNWGDTAKPGMARMISALKRYYPQQKPNDFFEQGYAQMGVAVQVLNEAAARGDLSHAGIIKALAQLPKVTFGGLSGAYTYGDPQHRSPPRFNTIFKVVPGAPLGLQALKEDFESTAARKFQF